MYQFSVKKDLLDRGIGDNIEVISSPTVDSDDSASSPAHPYQTDQLYLLLLTRHQSPYENDDVFTFVCGSLIIDAEEKSDNGVTSGDASLYGTDLFNHCKTDDASSAYKNHQLTDYIVSQISHNPVIVGTPYIRQADFQAVIANSDYILVVTVDYLIDLSFTHDRYTGTCTVNEILKGSLDQTTVRIVFPKDQVEQGKTYIVALYGDENLFTISSKNSIFGITERERIVNELSGKADS